MLTLVEEDGALCEVRFGQSTDIPQGDSALLRQAVEQMDAYFAGRLHAFTVPVRMNGTPFQVRCWQALLQIPYGETRTYAQQAAMIGSPKACRAVGMSNHRNPLPIVVPCHRVVGAKGKLTGYAGGIETKETLLRIERMNPS